MEKKKTQIITAFIILRGFEAGMISIVFGLILFTLLVAGLHYGLLTNDY